MNELSIFSESVLSSVFSEILFSTEITCSTTLIFFARKYIKVGTIKINKIETVIFSSEKTVSSRLITPILSLKK